MISCGQFRASFHQGAESPELLEHLRGCDACLPFALEVDSDSFFRSIGGSELVPPGGVDAFVGDVMREVSIRRAESGIRRRPVVTPFRQRLAVAAALCGAIVGGGLFYRHNGAVVAPRATPAAAIHAAVRPLAAPASRPVIEGYQSDSATIVEMPADSNDVKVVMIVDNQLPTDL